MLGFWLKQYGQHWLIPLTAAVLLPILVKAVFSLQRSRSQDRKDFLDLWTKRELADDLWLQVAIRHMYGQYLPVPVLRHLISQPQAGRALSDVSEVWPLIDWDEATSQLYWREPRHSDQKARIFDYRFSLVGYFAAAAVSMMGAWLVLSGYTDSGWVEWSYLTVGWGMTLYLLARQERLKTAEAAVPRWLGKMAWRCGRCSQDNDKKEPYEVVPQKRQRPKRVTN